MTTLFIPLFKSGRDRKSFVFWFWLEEKYMVLYADKCHIICLGKVPERRENTCDYHWQQPFKSNIKIFCKKAAQKKGDISRLLNHLSDSQKRLMFNFMIKSQFNYCPLNDNDTCNHQRNIQNLIVSTLKIKTNLNTPVMGFIFERIYNTYNPRNFQE